MRLKGKKGEMYEVYYTNGGYDNDECDLIAR